MRKIGLLVVVAALLIATSSARAAWQPEPAKYGVGEQTNVPVSMSDGTVLRVNVYYPTLAGGTAAPGPFPALLTQTPYGKDAIGGNNYLVQRGYVYVTADVRGTGDSEGSWGLFDPAEASDGAALVRWAARLPRVNGTVGLVGSSYMGITQFLTVGRLGRNSPVKALFPIITGNDLYRDSAFEGGILDGEFNSAYSALTASTNTANPPAETLLAHDQSSISTLPGVEAQHLGGLFSYHAAATLNTQTGGYLDYDGAYWQTRNPANLLAKAVADGIPAFLVGGWFDLFQHGEPLNYAGLQNAWDHRPVGAPMLPTQPVTGRYQLLMGPWYHLTAGTGIDINALELEWFDTWLKRSPTGMANTRTPLHLYTLGSGKWVDASTWPLREARPTTLYLGGGPSGSGAPSANDGTLLPAPPKAGSDQVVYAGASSPCTRTPEQWSMGAITLAAGSQPCANDDRTNQAGPGSLTYTTAPLRSGAVLGGPIDATVYATSTTADSEWVATIEDVSASGQSTPLTSGALLGSFRAVDPARSWMTPAGNPLLPYHPYSAGSVQAVQQGKLTRYDIEVFPTFASIAAGHRLRVTLATSDTPHLMPYPAQEARLAGGVYQLQRGPSFVELPLAPATAFGTPCAICK